jgi:ubiquinone/menaquinone biosynthesis C-methylase UbiE
VAARTGRRRVRDLRPDNGAFSLSEEQAYCLADPNGPNIPAAFMTAVAYLRAEPQITEAFRTGAGVAWGDHDETSSSGATRSTAPATWPIWCRPGSRHSTGSTRSSTAGARVADVGCGLGSTSVLLAEAYPLTTVIGSDSHEASIELARKRAADAGVADRVDFQVASAQGFFGGDYDLVTMFDCLHDMGDPLAAARRVREALAPDGTWLLVEPFAGDSLEDNLNPVGRLYYAGSMFLCLPNAMSQEGGYALGAQAGESAIRELVTEAGFTRFRRAAESPFNLVYEIRP